MEDNRAKLRELALEDLYFFCRGILGFDFFVPHVQGRVCNFLQHHPSNRKGLELPRGFLKSTAMIGRSLWMCLPERFLGDPWHNPNRQICYMQNIIDNAMSRIEVLRTIVESNPLIRELFPEIIPDNFHKTRWSNKSAQLRRSEVHPGATWEAAGVETTTTSRHYTDIIEDDIIQAKRDDLTELEAIPNPEEIQKAIGLHRLNYNLLVNQKTGTITNVGTPWAINDVIAWIKQNENYAWFVMPAAEVVQEEQGNPNYAKRLIRPTYPERFDLAVLAELWRAQGNFIFSSQYLLNPLSEEELAFREEQLQTFVEDPLLESCRVFTIVDPAISERPTADYAVILTGAVTERGRVFVLDYLRKRGLGIRALAHEIILRYKRFDPVELHIETVGYQKALKQEVEFQAKEEGLFSLLSRVREFNPGGKHEDSKPALIRGIQPVAERGDLFMKPWHKVLRGELLAFPYTGGRQHDDVANCLAILIRIMRRPGFSAQKPKEDPEKALHEIVQELRKRKRSGLPFKDQLGLSQRDIFNILGRSK